MKVSGQFNLPVALSPDRRLGGPQSQSERCTAGLFNAEPVIYFPGALLYSAGFNVNQNLKKKIFLNKSMFKFFS
jgi:hypothetical protein